MPESHTEKPEAERSPVRTWLVYFLLAVAFLFAVMNLNQVEVDWIIGTWQTPLVVVIVVSLAIGGVVGWVVARRRSRG